MDGCSSKYFLPPVQIELYRPSKKQIYLPDELIVLIFEKLAQLSDDPIRNLLNAKLTCKQLYTIVETSDVKRLFYSLPNQDNLEKCIEKIYPELLISYSLKEYSKTRRCLQIIIDLISWKSEETIQKVTTSINHNLYLIFKDLSYTENRCLLALAKKVTSQSFLLFSSLRELSLLKISIQNSLSYCRIYNTFPTFRLPHCIATAYAIDVFVKNNNIAFLNKLKNFLSFIESYILRNDNKKGVLYKSLDEFYSRLYRFLAQDPHFFKPLFQQLRIFLEHKISESKLQLIRLPLLIQQREWAASVAMYNNISDQAKIPIVAETLYLRWFIIVPSLSENSFLGELVDQVRLFYTENPSLLIRSSNIVKIALIRIFCHYQQLEEAYQTTLTLKKSTPVPYLEEIMDAAVDTGNLKIFQQCSSFLKDHNLNVPIIRLLYKYIKKKEFTYSWELVKQLDQEKKDEYIPLIINGALTCGKYHQLKSIENLLFDS